MNGESVDFSHRPVLLDECLQALQIKPDGIYVDATFGRGGHAAAILARLGPAGRLLGLDKDPQAIAEAQQTFGAEPRFSIHHGSFSEMTQVLAEQGLLGKVDGVLMDLGVSSPQLDDAERGFSFMRDGPLDMRMDNSGGVSAAEWLAKAKEADIAKVLKEYGEERFSKRVARVIVEARQEAPVETTGQLTEIIKAVMPRQREQDKHPATRSFQGIRIFINRELDDLRLCLEQMLEILSQEGRLVVISFHSLEDRIVKRFMRDQARGDDFPADLPVTVDQLNPKMRLVTKAIRASKAELEQNPRARSAVLRVAEKI